MPMMHADGNIWYNSRVLFCRRYALERKERCVMAERKSNLRKNFDWYYANLRRLLSKYRGRVIAFADGKVIGAYDSEYEAARSAIDSGHPLGTFAVHLCIPKRDEKPFVFTSAMIDFSKARI